MTFYRSIFLLLVGSALFLAGCDRSDANRAQPEIKDAFIKAMAPGQTTAAAYMVLHNPTDTDLIVNHVSTPVADRVEVHRVIYEDGMMKMRPVNHLNIARHSKLVFEPGGYHLMLLGVNEPLVPGQELSLSIDFEGNYSLSTKLVVQK